MHQVESVKYLMILKILMLNFLRTFFELANENKLVDGFVAAGSVSMLANKYEMASEMAENASIGKGS